MPPHRSEPPRQYSPSYPKSPVRWGLCCWRGRLRLGVAVAVGWVGEVAVGVLGLEGADLGVVPTGAVVDVAGGAGGEGVGVADEVLGDEAAAGAGALGDQSAR